MIKIDKNNIVFKEFFKNIINNINYFLNIINIKIN